MECSLHLERHMIGLIHRVTRISIDNRDPFMPAIVSSSALLPFNIVGSVVFFAETTSTSISMEGHF